MDARLPRLTQLTQLLSEERADDAIVAWRSRAGGDHPVTWREFRGAVSELARILSTLPSGHVALYTLDSYAFAVGLFAIWHAGRVAVCPPNGQPDALSGLSDVVIAAVSDGPGAVPGRPLVSPEIEGTATSAPAPARVLARDAPALELFTSGTTGRGKAVPKAIRHLEDEVRALEAHLGAQLLDAMLLGSASHQHLYGMLFRVLWPLSTGRPFHATMLLQAEELQARLRDRGPCALVSVPAHLKRLAERNDFASLARRCRVVFSSGGPLDAGTAARWEAATGRAPVEIFGSTETGGVAWRGQGAGRENAPWTPFDGVRVSRDDADGRLRVHSKIASVGDERSGFAMGDRIRQLADGRFVVEGRADRVLKIGERRVSLPDMEERLREHGFVIATALLPLERGGETRVAAVVVLSDEGRAALHERGHRETGLALRDALGREWDRVLLPRAFRFVDALPEDAQGKVTLPLLRRLFDAAPAAPAGDAP